MQSNLNLFLLIIKIMNRKFDVISHNAPVSIYPGTYPGVWPPSRNWMTPPLSKPGFKKSDMIGYFFSWSDIFLIGHFMIGYFFDRIFYDRIFFLVGYFLILIGHFRFEGRTFCPLLVFIKAVIYGILTMGSKELRDLQNGFFFCYWSFFEQILSQPWSILLFSMANTIVSNGCI